MRIFEIVVKKVQLFLFTRRKKETTRNNNKIKLKWQVVAAISLSKSTFVYCLLQNIQRLEIKEIKKR